MGKKVKVYAVDPHTGSSEHKESYCEVWTFEEFKKNIRNANLSDLIIPILKTSEEAAKIIDMPVELIFIDGAHEYDLVKLDFKLWFPKVINGSIIAFHDSVTASWPGPKKAVEELIYKSSNFRNVNFEDSITFAEKVEQNSLKDKIRNKYILFLKNLYEFGIKLHLPEPIKSIGKKFFRLIARAL
ncbi:class I SAM-dependent methyltransferase [[Eubacterium] cellulosolvens]